MRIVCVTAARPNFMKVKPVADALQMAGAEVTLVHTGQHYDLALSGVFFDELGLRPPDRSLGVGSGTHAEQTGRVMQAFEPLLAELRPDAVVLVGDVNSTMACALVAAKAGPLVAHVEAGLRSRDWSMPEEVNRVVTDRVSDLLLAPSADATDNLAAEGYREDQIILVGNSMVDTLLANIDRARRRRPLERLGVTAGGYALVTLHRPANVDHPAIRDGIVSALVELSTDLPVLLPAHPRAGEALRASAGTSRVRVIEPLGYLDFVALQDGAALVLTDSGGVQEETTVLGVPCLTLRDNTERPITVSEGTNRVVGTEPTRIVAEARKALAAPPPPRQPALWDGQAGHRIADAIVAAVKSTAWPRPTQRPGSEEM